MRDRGPITSAVRHTTLLARYSTVRRYLGGMLAFVSGGKGGSCRAGFGGDTGGVDWLCSVPKVPATVLVLTQLRCRDAWGTTTTAVTTRMAQAGPGL